MGLLQTLLIVTVGPMIELCLAVWRIRLVFPGSNQEFEMVLCFAYLIVMKKGLNSWVNERISKRFKIGRQRFSMILCPLCQ